MSKHLTGSKRLQVIQNWLNGRDDPDWDVLPTKKENKYIVKRRTEPLAKSTVESKEEPNKIEPQPELKEEEDIKEPEPQPIIKQKPVKKQVINGLQSDASSSNSDINFEILSELRALGQEMRMKREKKEQKKMIREVMNKELYKRNQYTQPLALQQESAKLPQYIQQPNELESDDEEPEPVPPRQQLSRRRNNIFSDIY